MPSLTQDRRRDCARQFLINAARRYDAALADVRALAVAFAEFYPDFENPPALADPAAVAEHVAWRNLVEAGNAAFDASEELLGSAIYRLLPQLGGGSNANYPLHTPTAILTGGTIYVLNYNPDEFVAETNLIALVRHDQPFRLD